MGGSKKEVYKVTLPGGGQTRMHNGDRGFLKRNPTTLRIWSSWRCLPGCGITLTDKLAIGKKSNMCVFVLWRRGLFLLRRRRRMRAPSSFSLSLCA